MREHMTVPRAWRSERARTVSALYVYLSKNFEVALLTQLVTVMLFEVALSRDLIAVTFRYYTYGTQSRYCNLYHGPIYV